MSTAAKIDRSLEQPAQAAADQRELGVHLGAYSWIQQLRTRRGRTTLSEADKPLLMHLWSFAAWTARGDARVWPSRARLASETGATLAAIKGRLSRLAAAGWVRRRGRGWDLAWQVPFTERPPEPPGEQALPSALKQAPEAVEHPAERPLDRPANDPSGRSRPRHDQPRINDLGCGLESTTPVSDPPTREHMPQQHLFDAGQNREQPRHRDRAREVFDYLAERIVTTKRDLGITPARGPTRLSPADRKLIEARIAEYDAAEPDVPDAGVIACKQVIDVDEFDSRRDQAISTYWNATTPFRPDNFQRRLLRWRADGKHQPFGGGGRKQASGVQVQRSRNDGGWYPHMSVEDRDALWASVELDFDELVKASGS